MNRNLKPRLILPNQHGIDRSIVSFGAKEAINKLLAAGFRAELVGGCVRDMLRGAVPKDFDVSTNATPQQITELFPGSRIIGRRFKIVPLKFGNEFVEVTTYRSAPSLRNQAGRRRVVSSQGRVLSDNSYGSIEQDAFRRDFTMNALYLRMSDFAILDYVNGYADVTNEIVRVIGNPNTRYREDPVRMLRAIRFVSSIGFELEANTGKSIAPCSSLLEEVPRARLSDELKKSLFHGYALDFYNLSLRYGLFARLFPVYSDKLFSGVEFNYEQFLDLLFEDTDRRLKNGEYLSMAYTFAAVLWPALKNFNQVPANKKKQPKFRRRGGSIEDRVLHRQLQRIFIPSNSRRKIIEIWGMQHRLEYEHPASSNMIYHRNFRAALRLFQLRAQVGEVDIKLANHWERRRGHAKSHGLKRRFA